jgi:hypothetical protein
MPKIHEEIIVVKVCKLLKNNESPGSLISDELVDNISTVIEELVGHDLVVEVERA